MVMDAPDPQEGLRRVRGAVEQVVSTLGGDAARVTVDACPPFDAADREGATATLAINGKVCGAMRLFSDAALRHYGVDRPVAGAEIELGALLALWPPKSRATPPPAFPAIERDLSIVVDERVTWASIAGEVQRAQPALLDGLHFVGVYRGKQAGEGRKSVTMRLRFRDESRTLRHEEVDPQVASVVAALERSLGAAVRR
jgi:phenylalanyl-tRNA synthetase beta chain